MELLASPFQSAFEDFAQSATASCLLCSPYITRKPVTALVESITQRGLEQTIHVHVLTDLSARHLLDGVTDVGALRFLHESIAHVTITYLPRLHAKVYVADDALALITSANYTEGGSVTNFEYGIRTRDRKAIAQVRHDISAYATLGSEVSSARLNGLQERVARLRESVREEKRVLNRALREASQELREFNQHGERHGTLAELLTRQTENELIRIRVEKRSINAIFAETILYLLEKRPLTTPDLHTQIRQIHADLCDDTIDRVIDGVHYGKKWKHQVRNAQVGLRRASRIILDEETNCWQLASRGE